MPAVEPIAAICSARKGLAKERDATMRACRTSGFSPDLMEHKPASIDSARTISLGIAERCDVFILLLAHRYGSRPREGSPSYTDLEFRRALRLRKPILAFAMDASRKVRPKHVETDSDAVRRLAAMRALAAKPPRVLREFRNPDHLYGLVAEALREWLARWDRAPQPGATPLATHDDVASVLGYLRQADAKINALVAQNQALSAEVVRLAEMLRHRPLARG
ncbi:MAG: DUF4062 domain-containing protein [Rubrivivax sp.]|nr:DUF4062 domain-containing protein [Rubrivivax sp.]